eukprot:6614747-Lingulodinium_polyedra.AAC.1
MAPAPAASPERPPRPSWPEPRPATRCSSKLQAGRPPRSERTRRAPEAASGNRRRRRRHPRAGPN